MTIFDLVKSNEITAYWEEKTKDKPPYLFETLFPDEKQLGMQLSFIKGASGLPVMLNVSAFDVKAVPRARMGFEKLTAEMPFFKESTYIDEKLRQELNLVMASGNQKLIDVVVNRIFADTVKLVESARVSREAMRAMAVTSGVISLTANGQNYDFDYGVPSNHKFTETNFNTAAFDVVSYINDAADKVEDDTGVRPSRAVCSRDQIKKLMNNETIKKSVYLFGSGGGTVNEKSLISFLEEHTGIRFEVYTKRYIDSSGNSVRFIPDNTIVLLPDGILGNTYFGTTPEESDLMNSAAANVSITDTGVAVTTVQHTDPVNVETKVSMICLPSFETANQIAVIDTTPAAEDDNG